MRGGVWFCGVDGITQKVTFERRQEESSKEFSGEEGRARRPWRGSVPGALEEQPGDPVAGPEGGRGGGHTDGPPHMGLWVLRSPSLRSGVRVGGNCRALGRGMLTIHLFILLCPVAGDIDLQNRRL